MVSKSKRKSQRLSRKKDTLVKKVHEMAQFCKVDVALLLRIRKTGRCITYRSVDLDSWPSLNKQTNRKCYFSSACNAVPILEQ